MSTTDIITIVITAVGLIALCLAFTFLFHHYYASEINKIETGQKDIFLLDDTLMESKKKHKKMRKVFSVIRQVISYIVLIIVIFFFGVAIVNKVQGETTFVNNTSLIVIASGSMSERNSEAVINNNLTNQFNTYDVIGLSKYSSKDDVKLYDVIAYTSKDGSTTVVHRIVSLTVGEDGELQIITQGDSNTTTDTGTTYNNYLTYDKIIGYYNGTRIQGVGIVVYFLQSAAGIMTIVSIVYCFLMYDFLSRRYEKSVNKRSAELLELVNFDFDDEAALDEAEVTYHEALIYKGQAYYFADNQFVEKGEAPLYSEPVYMRKREGGEKEIYVKDVVTMDVQHINQRTLNSLEVDEDDENQGDE